MTGLIHFSVFLRFTMDESSKLQPERYKISVLRPELEKEPGGFNIQYAKFHLFPLFLVQT
jgi:hypothetical protein